MNTSMKRTTVVVFIALALVAACGRGADPEGLALLRAEVPEIGSGVVYITSETDGTCNTDCPGAGLSRGNVVECVDLSAVHDDYEQRLIAGGFSQKTDDTYAWTKDSGDRTLVVNLLSYYENAAEGPQPNKEPYVDSPGDLVGACAVFVWAGFE